MNLWWMLTVEWPCALSNWLWAYLAAPLLAHLERLTFKRVVYLAALILLVIAFAQLVSIDLAFVWAGDAAFYFEVASAVMLYVVKDHARQTLLMAGQKIRAEAERAKAVIRRCYRIARQRRNANALQRRRDEVKRSDDEPAAWGQYAFA